MNKADIVKSVSESTGLPIHTTSQLTNAIFDALTAALKRGEEVELRGVGTFHWKFKKGNISNLPGLNGMKYPDAHVQRFKPAKEIKQRKAE